MRYSLKKILEREKLHLGMVLVVVQIRYVARINQGDDGGVGGISICLGNKIYRALKYTGQGLGWRWITPRFQAYATLWILII